MGKVQGFIIYEGIFVILDDCLYYIFLDEICIRDSFKNINFFVLFDYYQLRYLFLCLFLMVVVWYKILKIFFLIGLLSLGKQ